MKFNWKAFTAAILCLIMVLSLFPATAMAKETPSATTLCGWRG